MASIIVRGSCRSCSFDVLDTFMPPMLNYLHMRNPFSRTRSAITVLFAVFTTNSPLGSDGDLEGRKSGNKQVGAIVSKN